HQFRFTRRPSAPALPPDGPPQPPSAAFSTGIEPERGPARTARQKTGRLLHAVAEMFKSTILAAQEDCFDEGWAFAPRPPGLAVGFGWGKPELAAKRFSCADVDLRERRRISGFRAMIVRSGLSARGQGKKGNVKWFWRRISATLVTRRMEERRGAKRR